MSLSEIAEFRAVAGVVPMAEKNMPVQANSPYIVLAKDGRRRCPWKGKWCHM